MKLTEEELAGLSEAERKALEDGEGDNGAGALDDLANEDDDDDDQPADKGKPAAAADDDDGDGDDSTPPAKKEDEKPEASTAAADTSADGDGADEPFIPRFKSKAPADADAQIKAAQDEIDAARDKRREALKQYDAGTIDSEAYAKALDDADTAVDTARERMAEIKAQVREAKVHADTTAELQQQASEHEWQRASDRFMKAKIADEGIDYRGKPALLHAFNYHLKAIANDKANQDKDAEWLLAEAHKLTKADLGLTGTTEKKGEKAGQQASTERRVDKSTIPPSLRGAPVAAQASTEDNEFAHLEGLTGAKLEAALTKMTPEQLERYGI